MKNYLVIGLTRGKANSSGILDRGWVRTRRRKDIPVRRASCCVFLCETVMMRDRHSATHLLLPSLGPLCPRSWRPPCAGLRALPSGIGGSGSRKSLTVMSRHICVPCTVHTNIYTCAHTYIPLCVCVCVCVGSPETCTGQDAIM